MKEIVSAVFLMLVLLVGFPSSVANFPAFADDKDDNDNLYVSSEKFEDAIEDADFISGIQYLISNGIMKV